MQTGYIKYTTQNGGEIAIEGGGSIHFNWRDSSLNPNGCGHATQVEFFIREVNGKKHAVRVRLQSEPCPKGY